MKKHAEKIGIICLVVCLLVSVLTACGNNSEQSSSSQSADNSSQPADSSSQDETPGSSMRLVEEGETAKLKVWRPTHTTIGTRIEGFGDTLFNQWMAEQTGVEIEWITPVGGTEIDNLSMLISSGQYPDIFVGASPYYTTGAHGLMKDGIAINLAEYLDQVPNFAAQLNQSDLRKKESYSDDGELAAFYNYFQGDIPDVAWYGILMRKDLLDQVGMEVPKTYDQWHDVLVAFRDECGIEKPYLLNYNGFPKLNMFTGGLGFGYMPPSQPFYQIDGTVHYAPLEDGFKQYLQMMNQWYEEDLIDPDFMSLNSTSAEMTAYADPQTGSMVAPISLANVLVALSPVEGVEFVAVPHPVVSEDDPIIHIGPVNSLVGPGMQITTSCSNLELALKWCDLYYAEEVIFVSNWGTDESNYYLDEDGNYRWTEKVLADPDGFAPLDMMYSIADSPSVRASNRDHNDEWLLEVGSAYNAQNDNAYAISSSVTMTTEENDIYASVMADINDYVEEMQVKYILGIESFDQYDQFVEQIRSMGIEDAMTAYQAALDRYNAR